jgi:hypothetical protein
MRENAVALGDDLLHVAALCCCLGLIQPITNKKASQE